MSNKFWTGINKVDIFNQCSKVAKAILTSPSLKIQSSAPSYMQLAVNMELTTNREVCALSIATNDSTKRMDYIWKYRRSVKSDT